MSGLFTRGFQRVLIASTLTHSSHGLKVRETGASNALFPEASPLSSHYAPVCRSVAAQLEGRAELPSQDYKVHERQRLQRGYDKWYLRASGQHGRRRDAVRSHYPRNRVSALPPPRGHENVTEPKPSDIHGHPHPAFYLLSSVDFTPLP